MTRSRRALRRTPRVVALLVALVLVAVTARWLLSHPSRVPLEPPSTLGSGFSSGSSWYQVYFTQPRYPDNPANHHGGIDTHLVALMDGARTSIDVADYDFDLATVADAMARAERRSVRVRMVTDTDTLESTAPAVKAAFATLNGAGIPIVDDRRGDIMHDKFTVVDGAWVETGSWNYTDGDTYRLNNNMIVIHSRDLAADYTGEFEKMFVRHQFGPSKSTTNSHPSLTIDGSEPARVQACFAPEGHCGDLLVGAVQAARHSIRFMAFSFTDDAIGRAMLARARAGVSVQGVFETTGSGTVYSEYGPLKQAGLDVYTDGNPWSMHHKVIIVDDQIVAFGSSNFSQAADTSNDENLLIVDDPALARAFTTEYDAVLAAARSPVRP